jgi:hypothetical protein
MADTTTITCTEKRGNSAGDVYEPGTVYTRTFTFPVLASATGYGAADVLNLVTIPANTQVVAIAMKASVAQATGATFTFSIDSGSALSAALAPTTANLFYPSAVTDANAATASTDGTLKATIGTNTCDAGTITVTLVLAGLGTTSNLTTYTV